MPDLYVVKKDGVAIDVQTSTAGVVGLNEFVDGKISGAEARHCLVCKWSYR